MKSNIYVYDIEVYINCFTYTALNIESKEVIQFSIWKDINELQSLLEHFKTVKGHIGFNNINYDYPILHYIINNQSNLEKLPTDEITKTIYEKSQQVIQTEFSYIKKNYVKIPQLDLYKIWHFDNKARATSLKKLEIAMRYDNVQDLPFYHGDDITEQQDYQTLLDYNLNDVKATYQFYLKTISKIDLRKQLYKIYGLECINLPDSKIGEELSLKLYCDETESNLYQVQKLRTKRSLLKFKDCIPNYIRFQTDEFNQVVNYLETIEVKEIKDSFKYNVEYKGFTFDLGTGGIHGCIKAGMYQEDDEFTIIDVDVASLYPSLAIANNLYPKHLGEEFIKVYKEGIVEPRLDAKRRGDDVMSAGLKLAANSVYGKSNSEYSWLYDPLYTLQTTLSGQLSLLMLSEQVMLHIKDLTMLQINTDGLTVLIPRTEEERFFNYCKEWEQETNLVLESVSYKQMVIRDVNNYLAESVSGKVKLKGCFKTYEEMIKDEEYHKGFNQAIVPHALKEFYLNGVDVEQTIMNCNNIYDFCKSFNTTAGWKCETVKDDIITPQQKTNRYYISNDGSVFRKLKDDRVIEIEAGGTLVNVFNQYVEYNNFGDYDVNYQYYIDECYKIIHRIDGTEERRLEEYKEQREKEQRERQEEKFLKFCINKQPTQKQYDTYAKDWLLEKYKEHKIIIKGSEVMKDEDFQEVSKIEIPNNQEIINTNEDFVRKIVREELQKLILELTNKL